MRLTRAARLRTASLAALSAVLQPPAAPAHAWCGEKVPGYVLPQVGRNTVRSPGKAPRRCCAASSATRGAGKTGVPPVLLVGNPGVGYDYRRTSKG